jgi:hypothetical protein
VPAGDPHTFGNADTNAPARLLGSCSPAKFIDFFRALATLPLDGEGRVDRAELVALMDQYASHPYAA